MFQSLMFALALLAPTAHAEDSIANSATSALTTVSQGIGQFGQSQQQMQMLVNQMSVLNNLQTPQSMQANQAQLNALNQMKMQLSQAMSEAQMCVANAKKDTSKFKKATIAGKSLETVEPTCENYGNVIDSLRKNAEQINEANTKIACVRNLQNKINQIAETAKAPFKQLTEAAAKVYNTRDKIIKIHENIATQIEKDLNGEQGFRSKLAKLQDLALQMNNDVSALGTKIDSLAESRVSTANAWFGNIISRTQSCYDSTPQPCFGGTAMPAAACLASYIGRTSKDNPALRVQSGKNSQIASSMNALTATRLQDVVQLIKADVKDQNGFLKLVDAKFSQVVNQSAQEMQATQFVGNSVNVSEITSFMKARYNACYKKARDNFSNDINTPGSAYNASVKKIEAEEKSVALQAKNLIQSAQNQMTAFKTSFTKTYNRDLSMFTANCTAGEDANASVDCLRKVQAMLNSGINGHSEQVKMNNGSMITVDAGTTAISIPNLQLDASGQPASSSGTTTCAGFQECITVMSQAQESHAKAGDTEKMNQEKFVEQSNSDISNVMGGIATSFTTMSQMITAAVTSLNTELDAAGVSAILETKEAEGEELEKDKKTGLFMTPKSMKAAFAGAGSYSEMGDTKEASSAINERKGVLLKKMQDAAKMKSSCELKKSDYSSVANAIGSCDKVCKGNNMSKVIRPMEVLLQKSQSKAKTSGTETSKIRDAYERCMRSAKSVTADDSDDDIDQNDINSTDDKEERKTLRKTFADQQKRKKSEKKDKIKEEKASCAEIAGSDLETMAGESRSGVRTKNVEIAAAISKIGAACTEDGAEEDAGQAECESVKTLLTGYTPTNNGETPTSSSGDALGSSKSDNPFKAGGAQ